MESSDHERIVVGYSTQLNKNEVSRKCFSLSKTIEKTVFCWSMSLQNKVKDTCTHTHYFKFPKPSYKQVKFLHLLMAFENQIGTQITFAQAQE